jgi:hypothetical protein
MPRSHNPLAEFLITRKPAKLRRIANIPMPTQRFGVSGADRAAIASASASAICRRPRRGCSAQPGPVSSSIFEIEISEISEVAEVPRSARFPRSRRSARSERLVRSWKSSKSKRFRDQEISEIKEISEISEIREW